MNQSEFSKHLQEFERQAEKDLKYLLKKRRIEDRIQNSSGFLHFIFNLQKEILELQHPFHTSISLGGAGSGKMIRRCSKCGKSQEDGSKFDYYHIREGAFCTECRNPNGTIIFNTIQEYEQN